MFLLFPHVPRVPLVQFPQVLCRREMLQWGGMRLLPHEPRRTYYAFGQEAWAQWSLSPVVTSGHQCSPVVTLFCCQAAGISEQDPQREVLGLDFALLGGSFCSSAIAKNGCLFQEKKPMTYDLHTNKYILKKPNVSCIYLNKASISKPHPFMS